MQPISSTSLSGTGLGNAANGSSPSGGSASGTTSIAARSTDTALVEWRARRDKDCAECRSPQESVQFKRSAKGAQRGHGQFRAEIMQRLRFRFAAEFSSQAAVPASYQPSGSAQDVAAEVLGRASQALLASDQPPQATINTIRQSVEDAAAVTNTHADDGAESIAVGETVSMINKGLEVLERRITPMSSSEINVEARSKQRTSIRIRTQEGDVVRFDLRNVSRLSLSDTVQETDGESYGMTELTLSSNSRLRIMVKGDLNDAELEAIRSVFAAAENIANEFFAGDINAALEIAAGLEIDAEQLALVSMGFRSSTRIHASQTLTQSGPAVVAPSVTTDETAVDDSPAAIAGPQTEPGTVERPDPPKPAPTSEPTPTTEPAPATAGNTGNPAAPALLSGFGYLADFLGMLANFLEQTATRFSGDADGGSVRNSMRIDFKQSFQLDILRSVMSVIATDMGVENDEADGSKIQELADSIGKTGEEQLSDS